MSRRQLVRAVLAGGTCLAAWLPVSAQKFAPAGDGVIYVGTYANKVYKVSEATMRVVDSIPVSIGIPTGLLLSANRKHLYIT
ncbi:MAG: hypothetical protein ABI877_16385, partial [Gemmatimonadaceae bacterium]